MRPAPYLLLLFAAAFAVTPVLAATNQTGQDTQASHPSNVGTGAPKASGQELGARHQRGKRQLLGHKSLSHRTHGQC